MARPQLFSGSADVFADEHGNDDGDIDLATDTYEDGQRLGKGHLGDYVSISQGCVIYKSIVEVITKVRYL